MATPSKPRAPADVYRTWALRQLDARRSATLDPIRGAVFDRLEEGGLVLESASLEAVAILFEGRSGGECFRQEREAALASAIDAFAHELFTLDPSERDVRFERLTSAAAAHAHLAARLARLRPGLAVDIRAADALTADAAELARLVLSIFPCDAIEHARQRAAATARMQAEARRWSRAASSLARHAPTIAALEPSFVAWIQDAPRRARVAKRAPKVQKKNRSSWPAFLVIVVVSWVFRGVSNYYEHVVSPTLEQREQSRQLIKSLERNFSQQFGHWRHLTSVEAYHQWIRFQPQDVVRRELGDEGAALLDELELYGATPSSPAANGAWSSSPAADYADKRSRLRAIEEERFREMSQVMETFWKISGVKQESEPATQESTSEPHASPADDTGNPFE